MKSSVILDACEEFETYSRLFPTGIKQLLGTVGGWRVHRFFHARQEKQHVNRTNQRAQTRANQNYITQKSAAMGRGYCQKWAWSFRLVASSTNNGGLFLEATNRSAVLTLAIVDQASAQHGWGLEPKWRNPGPKWQPMAGFFRD